MGLLLKSATLPETKYTQADEAFLSGTAAQIKPIIEIDSRALAGGTVGKTTKKLQEHYEKIVRGKAGVLSKNWLTYVQ